MKAPSSPALLIGRQLQFAYGKHSVFSDLNLDIPPGLSVVTGEENSGKTTLLRLLAAELMPTQGELALHGIHARSHTADYRAQVFWADARSPVWDAMAVPQYLKSLGERYPALQADLLHDLLDALALQDHLDKRFEMLSAGTRRKVFLAAGFASGAALTLLDTPFAALDKASVSVVLELLEDAAQHATRAWVLADYEVPDVAGFAQHLVLPYPA